MKAKILNTLSQITSQSVVDVGFVEGLIVDSREHGSNHYLACLPQNIGESLNSLVKKQEG